MTNLKPQSLTLTKEQAQSLLEVGKNEGFIEIDESEFHKITGNTVDAGYFKGWVGLGHHCVDETIVNHVIFCENSLKEDAGISINKNQITGDKKSEKLSKTESRNK